MTRRTAVLLVTSSLLLAGRTCWALVSEEDRRAGLQMIEDYDAAPNKLEFLLARADSTDESVLVWVATELGSFENERAIGSLRGLAEHRQRDRAIPSVAVRARDSLERIAVAPLTKRLATGDQSIEEGVAVAAELSGMDNRAARRAALRFLCGNLEKGPAAIVPLLVRHFPHDTQARYWARRHPDLVKAEIMVPLRSQQPHLIEGAAKLAAEVRATRTADQLAHFLYADRDHAGFAGIWRQSIATLVTFGDDAVPSVTNILYSRNRLTQLDAIAVLRQINTRKARASLAEFRKVLVKYPRPQRRDELMKRVDHALSLPEDRGAE